MASVPPAKELAPMPGTYTVEFTTERLGFRVVPCSDHDQKLRVGNITNEMVRDQITEGDEIYALNGYVLGTELNIHSHQAFQKMIVNSPERPLLVTFLGEEAGLVDALGTAAAGALALFSNDEDGEEVVKVTSVSFNEKGSGFDLSDPNSRRSSMRMDYDVKETGTLGGDLFGLSTGYHAFSLRYTKHLKLDDENPTVDAVELAYFEFGQKVLVRGGEMGVVVHHYKCYNRKKEWDKAGDTCDVKMPDGTMYQKVIVGDLTPVEVIFIPLACGLSLEDFCLYGACLTCIWAGFCVMIGMLMFAHEETASAQTALTTFFYLTIGFMLTTVVVVYIGRTLAVIQEDEKAGEEERAATDDGDEQDEEVGLIGGVHFEVDGRM